MKDRLSHFEMLDSVHLPVRRVTYGCAAALMGTLVFCVWLVKRHDNEGTHCDFRGSDLISLKYAIKSFAAQQGHAPTRQEGLMALVKRPSGWPEERKWSILMDRLPKDGWGNDFDYTATPVDGGIQVSVRDRGPDGIPFNGDDEELDCGIFP